MALPADRLGSAFRSLTFMSYQPPAADRTSGVPVSMLGSIFFFSGTAAAMVVQFAKIAARYGVVVNILRAEAAVWALETTRNMIRNGGMARTHSDAACILRARLRHLEAAGDADEYFAEPRASCAAPDADEQACGIPTSNDPIDATSDDADAFTAFPYFFASSELQVLDVSDNPITTSLKDADADADADDANDAEPDATIAASVAMSVISDDGDAGVIDTVPLLAYLCIVFVSNAERRPRWYRVLASEAYSLLERLCAPKNDPALKVDRDASFTCSTDAMSPPNDYVSGDMYVVRGTRHLCIYRATRHTPSRFVFGGDTATCAVCGYHRGIMRSNVCRAYVAATAAAQRAAQRAAERPVKCN